MLSRSKQAAYRYNLNNLQVPGRYYPLEMDNATDFASNETLVVSDKCALDKSVQKLIIKLFDVKTMNKTLTEFEVGNV